MDMLSIRKERLHGMNDIRWMTKDKIVQYKGLINLFKRDKKITNLDKTASAKKDKKMLISLKKSILTDRGLLDNAIFGDRQLIENALSVDRSIKLAYHRLEPDVIIEHIQQQTFNCRKKLDVLQYEKLQKAHRLVDRKLIRAEMEDRILYENPGSLPVEVKCRDFTAYCQDAILKKEAAIVVNESYKKIISVMKKDQIYFDQILHCLRQDAKRQAKCMYDTIVLGQLAIEYLDDRREEFYNLEKAVQADMALRRITVKETKHAVASFSKNIKFFIRRDSDTNLGPNRMSSMNIGIQLQLSDVCNMLDILKDTFFVTSYLQLFDCLQKQEDNKTKLRALAHNVLFGRDRLQNKLDHANLMHTEMLNTINDGTFDYMEEKRETARRVAELEEAKRMAKAKREVELHLLTQIKISLQQMEQMCKVIKDAKERKERKAAQLKLKPVSSRSQKYTIDPLMREAMDIKDSCDEILQIVTPKLTVLFQAAGPVLLDDRTRPLADLQMQKMIHKRTPSVLKEAHGEVESLLEDVLMEDASVPTNHDIKASSREIVLANQNEDALDIPPPDAKKKK